VGYLDRDLYKGIRLRHRARKAEARYALKPHSRATVARPDIPVIGMGCGAARRKKCNEAKKFVAAARSSREFFVTAGVQLRISTESGLNISKPY